MKKIMEKHTCSRHPSQRLIAGILCLSLILPLTACGNSDTAPTTDTVSDTTTTSDSLSPSGPDTPDAPSGESPAPAAKKTYSDFYSEVNKDWLEANALEDGTPYIYQNQEATDLVNSRFEELLENASPEDFDADDPLRKMVAFYQQLREEGYERTASMARIKELTDTIESQKSLKQLYDNILKDETFSLFNNLMSVKFMPCMDYRFRVYYYPRMFSSLYIDKTEEERQFMVNGFSKTLELLGYAPDQALSMAQNAVAVDEMALKCLNGSGYSDLYYEDSEQLQGCAFPYFEIMKALNYEVYLTGDETEYCFFATDPYLSLINELFVPENLQMLKDYYAVCVIDKMRDMGSLDYQSAHTDILMNFWDVPENLRTPDMENSGHKLETITLLGLDSGALNKWYADTYVTEAQKADILAMAGDISAEMQQIVSDIEWASPKTKLNLNLKLKSLEYHLGCYEEYNMLTDMEIGATSVDTMLSLEKSNREYNKMFLHGTGLHSDTFTADLSAVNAYYLENSASIAIGNGILAQLELLGPDASYEEKLGLFGSIIAHEMSHGIDNNNIYLDRHIIAAEWYDEAHYENFKVTLDAIYYFFNGMTTELGNTIDAAMYFNEIYCDLVAMKCCLQMLSKRESADYDTFFQSYAKQRVMVMTPKYESFLLRIDSHLPYHERLNYLVGQYDEFYETYEIDEASPYFVPKEKRIVLFRPASAKSGS